MSESSPIGSVAVLVCILSVAALGATGVEPSPAEVRETDAGTVERPSAPRRRSGPLDLNRATSSELESLPRVGPALAQRIVAHRSAHGPFRAVDDLDAVKGIGPRLLERLRPLVQVAVPEAQNLSNTNPQRSTRDTSTLPAPVMEPTP